MTRQLARQQHRGCTDGFRDPCGRVRSCQLRTKADTAARAKPQASPSSHIRAFRVQPDETKAAAVPLQHCEPPASSARKRHFSASESWSSGAGVLMAGLLSLEAVRRRTHLAAGLAAIEARGARAR